MLKSARFTVGTRLKPCAVCVLAPANMHSPPVSTHPLYQCGGKPAHLKRAADLRGCRESSQVLDRNDVNCFFIGIGAGWGHQRCYNTSVPHVPEPPHSAHGDTDLMQLPITHDIARASTRDGGGVLRGCLLHHHGNNPGSPTAPNLGREGDVDARPAHPRHPFRLPDFGAFPGNDITHLRHLSEQGCLRIFSTYHTIFVDIPFLLSYTRAYVP
jgi:hypothetical protein